MGPSRNIDWSRKCFDVELLELQKCSCVDSLGSLGYQTTSDKGLHLGIFMFQIGHWLRY